VLCLGTCRLLISIQWQTLKRCGANSAAYVMLLTAEIR
jgi:hypothetical protein